MTSSAPVKTYQILQEQIPPRGFKIQTFNSKRLPSLELVKSYFGDFGTVDYVETLGARAKMGLVVMVSAEDAINILEADVDHEVDLVPIQVEPIKKSIIKGPCGCSMPIHMQSPLVNYCDFGANGSPSRFLWNRKAGEELQQVVDELLTRFDLWTTEFSVVISDPDLPDCPIVACSNGFSKLTGYTVEEIIGNNCRFLLTNVPMVDVDHRTRQACHAYCSFLTEEETPCVHCKTCFKFLLKKQLAQDAKYPTLPLSDLVCIQTNAKSSGKPFRNLIYMRCVTCDGRGLVFGLQAAVPDDVEDEFDTSLEMRGAWSHISSNMTELHQRLANIFGDVALFDRLPRAPLLLTKPPPRSTATGWPTTDP